MKAAIDLASARMLLADSTGTQTAWPKVAGVALAAVFCAAFWTGVVALITWAINAPISASGALLVAGGVALVSGFAASLVIARPA